MISRRLSVGSLLPVLAALAFVAGFVATSASAQVTAFKQAIAEAASVDDGVAAFYRSNGYQPIWTSEGDEARARRAALLDALEKAPEHGLPVSLYRPGALLDRMRQVRTTRDLGLVEVALSLAFVRYADDVQSGLLEPSRIDDGIDRKSTRRDGSAYLTELTQNPPAAYIRALPPRSGQYLGLIKAKRRLATVIADGNWGPAVPTGKYNPGDSGTGVVALRDRLIRMGYMKRSSARSYDDTLTKAVQKFQTEHGLEPDGVAGPGTVAEVNVAAEQRLTSVVVAMERERWLGVDRGDLHVLVNQTDFSSKIMDRGRTMFQTRAVIGKNVSDRRSPEFSDEMEYMIVNPSWHVPRSIMTKEYLPQLQRNPNAAGHMIITDSRGRRVDRGSVDFTRYSQRNFPFDMRQPPGSRNALGKVKFIFPNKHNVYMHDTPQKSLFQRESRAFSHGCIRLADPIDFAYTILALQTDDPKSYFDQILKSGRETKINLAQTIPVHIIYRTAFVSDKGNVEFRRDVYERDAKIWNALQRAGVVLPGVQG